MLKKSHLVLSLLFLATACIEPEESHVVEALPVLTGPYLGQTPPGDEPQLFAPGIINTGLYTRDVAMMPDGSEIYFGVTFMNERHP